MQAYIQKEKENLASDDLLELLNLRSFGTWKERRFQDLAKACWFSRSRSQELGVVGWS